MENNIRFYKEESNEMEILTWEQVVKEARPDLVGALVMPSVGIEANGKQLFAEDILELEVMDKPADAPFWRSTIGEVMREKGYERVVVYLTRNSLQEPEYVMLFKTHEGYVSLGVHDDIPEKQWDEACRQPLQITETGLRFLVFLCSQGAVVIGNKCQHAHVLPPQG